MQSLTRIAYMRMLNHEHFCLCFNVMEYFLHDTGEGKRHADICLSDSEGRVLTWHEEIASCCSFYNGAFVFSSMGDCMHLMKFYEMLFVKIKRTVSKRCCLGSFLHWNSKLGGRKRERRKYNELANLFSSRFLIILFIYFITLLSLSRRFVMMNSHEHDSTLFLILIVLLSSDVFVHRFI